MSELMRFRVAQRQDICRRELAAELLPAKESDGASKRYLQDLRSRLGQFSATFADSSFSAVHTVSR